MRIFSRSGAAAAAVAALATALTGCASASSSSPASAPSSSSPAAAPSSSTSSPTSSLASRTGESVPATAAVAMLTETRGMGGNGNPPSAAEATVTSVKQVAALAAYLNGLPVNKPGGVMSCPDDTGGAMTITFRAQAGGPVLAKVTAALSGCEFISYAMPGQATIGLGGGNAGRPLLAEVNRVTGLGWKAP